MTTQQKQELCGLFGKLPQQADFVRLHLPEDFAERWHAWLQAALSVSREQLAEEWLEYYLTSPVWRFALSPGAGADHAVVGAIVPSVDEVGRYYPLTVGHCGDHDVWSAYLSGEAWFDAVEQVAVGALGEDMGYMQLVEWLEGLPMPEFDPKPRYRTQAPPNTTHPSGWVVSAPDDAGREAVMTGLIDRAYTRWLGSYSLWWTKGSECVEPSLLVCAELPTAGQYAAMLDGEWQSWGWSQEQPVTPDKAG